MVFSGMAHRLNKARPLVLFLKLNGFPKIHFFKIYNWQNCVLFELDKAAPDRTKSSGSTPIFRSNRLRILFPPATFSFLFFPCSYSDELVLSASSVSFDYTFWKKWRTPFSQIRKFESPPVVHSKSGENSWESSKVCLPVSMWFSA